MRFILQSNASPVSHSSRVEFLSRNPLMVDTNLLAQCNGCHLVCHAVIEEESCIPIISIERWQIVCKCWDFKSNSLVGIYLIKDAQGHIHSSPNWGIYTKLPFGQMLSISKELTDLSSANGSVILWVGGGGVIALIRFNMFKTVFIVPPRNNYITFVFKPIDDDEHNHIVGLEDLHISSPFIDFYKPGQTRIDILCPKATNILCNGVYMSYSDNNNCSLSVGEGL